MVARVSNLMLAERMLRNIQRDLADLAKTHEQFSSGRLFSKPSENPFGFMTSLRVRELLTSQHRYASTVEGAISNLEFSETLLGSVNGIIQRSQEMAILASNSPMSDTAASSLGEELRQLFEEVFSTANSQNAGRYVFAGTRTDRKPFERGVDELGQAYVVYRGNTDEHRVEVDQGILVTDNMNGLEAFFAKIGTIRAGVPVSDPTTTLLTSVPNVPPPSNGDFSGTFKVNGTTITVTATDTLETLRDKINQANADVVASVDSLNRLVLQSNRTTQVRLEEGTSNVLQALGMLPTIQGTLIGAGLSDTTTLAAMGLTGMEAMRIELGDETLDLDLSSANTLGDVLTLINTSGLGVNAYINANQTGINITSLDSNKDIEISDTRRVFGNSFGIGIDNSMPLFALG
ncbi:MAG TPA: flagellar hook-associated protein FlgL, partial [bacterium]|nr:flagellar hook-associated protein FlgL [bacterium]